VTDIVNMVICGVYSTYVCARQASLPAPSP